MISFWWDKNTNRIVFGVGTKEEEGTIEPCNALDGYIDETENNGAYWGWEGRERDLVNSGDSFWVTSYRLTPNFCFPFHNSSQVQHRAGCLCVCVCVNAPTMSSER